VNFVFCFVCVTLINITNTPRNRSAALVLSTIATERTAAALASAKSTNPARNLSGAGLGRISEKWSDSGFTGDSEAEPKSGTTLVFAVCDLLEVSDSRVFLRTADVKERSQRCAVIRRRLKQNANEGCNSCASLAVLVLSFIACFILLVIAPLVLYLLVLIVLTRRQTHSAPTRSISNLPRESRHTLIILAVGLLYSGMWNMLREHYIQ